MIGAIAGDMIGSPYERYPMKNPDFFVRVAGFTDNTVLNVAVVSAILNGAGYAHSIKVFTQRHPHVCSVAHFVGGCGRGKTSLTLAGATVRPCACPPVGFAFEAVEEVLEQTKQSAEVSHNHPEGIKGAQATALAILIARQGADKEEVRKEIENRFHYDLHRAVEEIRPSYRFDISCQDSVPESIIALLDSSDYESAVKNAVSLGGDADTMDCIEGGIAQAFYRKVPETIVSETLQKLTPDLRKVVDRFAVTYGCEY